LRAAGVSAFSWAQFWFDVVRRMFAWLGYVGRGWHGRGGRRIVVGIPIVWLSIFFLLPLLILLKISLAEARYGQPPFTALLSWSGEHVLAIKLHFGSFATLLADCSDPATSLYCYAYVNSLKTAAVSTGLALLIGYPVAYGIARAPTRWRLPLLLLVVLPFWTSSLLRTYAWIGILKGNGLLNKLLIGLGLIETPLPLLHTDLAVYIGIVYTYLPFMVLPLVANLVRLDPQLLEAAADLGCRPWRAFLQVTLPLSMPGVIAGSLLVFIPAVGEFVIPELLGGPDTLMIGRVLWTEFFTNTDWPLASAIAVALLLLIVLPTLVFEYVQSRSQEAQAGGKRRT
jgi:putrescine transport system permease protein